MEATGYLIAAYLIAWAALFAYLVWMSGIARGLRAELADLRADLAERERQPAAAGHTAAPSLTEAPTAASAREVG